MNEWYELLFLFSVAMVLKIFKKQNHPHNTGKAGREAGDCGAGCSQVAPAQEPTVVT